MILIDTSVWVDYFKGKPHLGHLSTLINENRIVSHPWILGELTMGNLEPKRDEALRGIQALRSLKVYDVPELLDFVETEKLYGKGLALIDIQLLYASIQEDCLLWTIDKILHNTATRYDKAYFPG